MTDHPPLRELILLRHAKSDHSDLTLEDFDRPLNERGREDAHTIGKWIQQQALTPDFIITSPSKRTLQTLRRAQVYFDPDGNIPCEHHEDLYEAELSQILSVLKTVPAHLGRTLLVGHNPGLESLINYLAPDTSDSEDIKLFPTGAIAQLILPTHWDNLTLGSGKLMNLWRVKELPA